jgi:lysophospholipase L1-like esterase
MRLNHCVFGAVVGFSLVACRGACGAAKDAGADAARLDGGGALDDAGRDPAEPDAPTSPFQPCGAEDCFVFPLGDSITDGVGSSTGASYRTALLALAHSGGKTFRFVGSHFVGPDGPDEGHSGWVIQMIDDALDGFLDATVDAQGTHRVPQIVLLMIGTSDTNRDQGDGAPDRLGALLDHLTSKLPDALIVVAKIVPNLDTNKDSTAVAAYNSAMEGVVASRVATGKHLVLVDMHSALNPDASDFADGLHPTTAAIRRWQRPGMRRFRRSCRRVHRGSFWARPS